MGADAVGVTPRRSTPAPSRVYWICQAAGWCGFLAYVLGFYLAYAKPRAGEILSIVVFCAGVPPLLTHRLRAWMYARGWDRLTDWQRAMRSTLAALVLGSAVTVAVVLATAVSRGRVWVHFDGMWWMGLAYVLAFSGWLWIYDVIHWRRRRDGLEIEARGAQLRALRAQVNPHFLFNSLNSVRSLITEDPQRAASMITGLSDILRYSLASDRKKTVSLAEELGVIDEYLGVERVRFEERLRVERAIEPAALVAQVPPMLVQTLVENAVKHGIAEQPRGGVVRLEARVRDERLEIVVSNSGLFKPPADDSGFGLRNAAERLRLLYGGLASITVTDDGERTIAALHLPLELAG